MFTGKVFITNFSDQVISNEMDSCANQMIRSAERFGEHMQSVLRDERVKRIIAKKEKEEKQKEKQCKHIDSNGQQCNREKMQKKGADYCHKHRPK